MKKLIKNPLFIMAAAIVLLLASSAGATRAAIVYQSAQDQISFSTAQIKVALLENGVEKVDKDSKYSLDFGLGENDNFVIGKKYNEVLTVANNSSADYGYDEYVRVIITKSWYDTKTKRKVTSLDPSLIRLNVLTGEDWIFDEKNSTQEQSIYYLSKPLGQGQKVDLTDTLMIPTEVTELVTKEENEGNITTVYDYDGMSFYIDVEADAVQTHNAKAAIKGAWGIDVNISDSKVLSLVKEGANE